MSSPSVRLACCTGRTTAVFTKDSWSINGNTVLPSLLLSYAYEKVWLPLLPTLHIRNFVLDSGAFTAHSSGKPIDVAVYRDAVMGYRDQGVVPVEVFSLDVIGDWRGTKANTEYLWANGVEAIPAYHYGEPEDVLLGYAKDYPKIALGGAVGLPRKEKERWARQCFARVWPKPIHGFGFGLWAPELLPFHSVDCSDWEGSAARFGRWNAFGGKNIGLGGKNLLDNLACEAEVWLKAEHNLRKRWAGTFRKLSWPENILGVLA
jgi:hypothetical protein